LGATVPRPAEAEASQIGNILVRQGMPVQRRSEMNRDTLGSSDLKSLSCCGNVALCGALLRSSILRSGLARAGRPGSYESASQREGSW
jgi:hypothetical protein